MREFRTWEEMEVWLNNSPYAGFRETVPSPRWYEHSEYETWLMGAYDASLVPNNVVEPDAEYWYG